MSQLNAGSLFVEIGASTSKLDAELKRAKAELDALERNDPLVEVLVEFEDAKQIEQDLERKLAQIEAQPIDVKVDIDKNGDIPGAGKQIELFQSKLSKVLGIAAGLTAGVALFGGIAKGVRDAADSTGILADETTKAQGEFRAFASAVPVIGQLGIALSDIGIALGLVADGAKTAALEAKRLDLSLQFEASRKSLRRLQGDLDLLIQSMSRFDEVGTAAFDLEMFDLGLDPVQRQLEDANDQIRDELREIGKEMDKFARTPGGMIRLEGRSEEELRIFEDLEKRRIELINERFDLEKKTVEILELRRGELQNQRLREEMEEQQRIAAQEQADIEAAAALQAQEDAEFDKRMQERNANRMRAFEVEQEMLEDAKRLEERRLAIMQRMALAQAGINKSTLEALKKERDEIKSIGAERAATRRSLGETQAIDTAIGSFTIGRSFSPGDTVANIEEQTKKSVESIDKKIDGLEKIFKRIETKIGGSNGAFT